jgi:hypothetical protein
MDKIEPLIIHKMLPVDELKKLVYDNGIVIIKGVDFIPWRETDCF